jgi:two-component system NarL family sensor kinase
VVIALRRPANPIGWLFGTAGLVFAVVGFTGSYAIYAVLTRPGTPLGPEAAWLAQWIWPSSIGAIACVFLLFPDGRLLSPRWRPVLWLAGIAPVTAAVGFALIPGRLTEFRVADNPFGVEAAGALPEVIGPIGMVGLWFTLLGAGTSLVLRFRHAHGEQRQQLKWLAYAATLAAIA